MKRTFYIFFCLVFCFGILITNAQIKGKNGKILAVKPPMGWMTWNFFADKITEANIREIADAMMENGMLAAGYNYIVIDDGWQGGRDAQNNLIADPKKFPSGIKALAEYVHNRGFKLGIYSDAAPLTCAGYTGSLNFEAQDAKTFASWDIDYLKYDYCNAPSDVETAKFRYKVMADELRKTNRDIVFAICEWGHHEPWLWAAQAGGQVWRTTDDIRDKWQRKTEGEGEGVMEIVNKNLKLNTFSGPGFYNDMDMLIIGLYGKKGPSGDLGGVGCTDVEYQSQMSLWSMMNAPLIASNDIRNMNTETKRILLNKEVIALNQDASAIQANVLLNDKDWLVLIKKLQDGTQALAVLNKSDKDIKKEVDFSKLGLNETYQINDLWAHKNLGKAKKWSGIVKSHETKLFKLKSNK